MIPGWQWTPLRFLIGRNRQSLAARYTSVLMTIKTGKRVKVRWDGEDWVHRWADGALVNYRPTPEALKLGVNDLSLFFFDYLPRRGDTVIDVGAGIGTELKILSDLVGSTGNVVAVEADPAAFRRLTKLNSILGLSNTVLIEGAVGAKRGIAYLTQDDLDAIGNALTDGQVPGAIPVKMTTLDTLVDQLGLETINYVKMNIEGAERDALQGFTDAGGRVLHWCVSCHDFKGTEWASTHAFVKAWLLELGREVREHPSDPGLSHAGFYVYA